MRDCDALVKRDRGYATPLHPRNALDRCGLPATIQLVDDDGTLLAARCKRHRDYVDSLATDLPGTTIKEYQ